MHVFALVSSYHFNQRRLAAHRLSRDPGQCYSICKVHTCLRVWNNGEHSCIGCYIIYELRPKVLVDWKTNSKLMNTITQFDRVGLFETWYLTEPRLLEECRS